MSTQSKWMSGFRSNSRTTSTWPRSHAWWSAVIPHEMVRFTRISDLARRNLTTSKLLRKHAWARGVIPHSSSVSFTSTDGSDNMLSALAVSPLAIARRIRCIMQFN